MKNKTIGVLFIVLLVIFLGVLIQKTYPNNPNFNYITVDVKQNNSLYYFNNQSDNINVSIDICVTGDNYPFQLNIVGHNPCMFSLGLFFISNYTGNESLHNASTSFSQFRSISGYSTYLDNKFHHTIYPIPSFSYISAINLSNNSTKISINILKSNFASPGIYGLLLNNISTSGQHRNLIHTVYTNQVVVVEQS